MKKTFQKLSGLATSTATSLTLLAGNVQAATMGIGETEVSAPTGFAQDFGSVLNAVLSFVMVIAALLVFFYLIMGGIEWITSGGDKGKTEGARNKITAAVVGLIILAASYAILQLVLRFLGFADLNDALQFQSIS